MPTPIGNLGDITARAVEVLRDADCVAAEDTRRSRILLDHLGLDRRLVRLDAHTMTQRAPALLDEHEWLAFVTDAGTPGISDPGADLVALALGQGHQVEVLPGATAFVPALVASGLPTARFTFEGFLPRKGSARKRRLRTIAESTATTIVYEAPYRLAATLRDLAAACGDLRQASVSRELSKLYEETRRGSLRQLHEHYGDHEVKGEVVVVIAGIEDVHDGVESEGQGDALSGGMSVDEVAERLTAAGIHGRLLRGALEALGAARNVAYQAALQQAQASPPASADETGPGPDDEADDGPADEAREPEATTDDETT